MSERVVLRPPPAVAWSRRPPGSKSITNRALLLAAVAQGRSRLTGWLDADDTAHMRTALGALGIAVHEADDGALEVQGCGGPIPAVDPPPQVFVGTAGTVARFLLAVLAASPGEARMDGTARMRERPMATLIEALRELGAPIECLGTPGALPLVVGPNPEGLRGGEVRLARPASSQFVSGLVFASALARTPTTIVLEQGTPARPYVDMTLSVLQSFGGSARWRTPAPRAGLAEPRVESAGQSGDVLTVEPARLHGCDFEVEPDASAASYPLALAAIWGGRAEIDGLGTDSLQGDVRFAELLGAMGAAVRQDARRTVVTGTGRLHGGTFDLSDTPDMTLTLAVVALFADTPTTIEGVEILRHHESDRLAAAAAELRKLGAKVVEREDGLLIEPPSSGPTHGVTIETYDDHRMAMAFSLVGDVVISNPGCVAKTYPAYFRHLADLGMVVPSHG